ncbi:glucose-1-phosphate adenylyltransferase subunit GlgD, partial [Clostridium sp.]|uniref:glucose-1-phosphate adenylyltransferase subunit GlgD n=1 Tax=Clostridium sp. TaxID=1506 RepID=UPI002FC998BE
IKELTNHRPIAAIPFLGRYRIIDFVLSNMVNSGILNVGVFIQEKPRPLTEHLGVGESWDLDRKKDGLFLFYPYYNSSNSLYMTEMKSFRDNMDYIENSRQKYVIISPSYMICNIDYREAVNYHKNSKADITVIHKKVQDAKNNFLRCDTLNINEDGRVTGLATNKGDNNEKNVSMEMYIMKKEFLLKLINKASELSALYSLKDTVIYFHKEININAFEYKGYLECINSISAYFNKSLELLNMEKSKELFKENYPIHTMTKDNAPTKYGTEAKVCNSLIANGAIIEGTVENSIIFRGVKIGKGAVVKNSILMSKTQVGDGVHMENAIADKNSVISRVKNVLGIYGEPIVIEKNSIV